MTNTQTPRRCDGYDLDTPIDATNAVTQLDYLCSVRAHIDNHVAETVRLARSQGASWTAIGEAIGVTKQAAWERYGQ